MSDWVLDVLTVFAGFVLIPVVAAVAVMLLALITATLAMAFVYTWESVDLWIARRRRK